MAKLRRRDTVDREEAERLLARARILAGYMLISDVGSPSRDVLETMGAPELRAIVKRNSDCPLAPTVLALLDGAAPSG